MKLSALRGFLVALCALAAPAHALAQTPSWLTPELAAPALYGSCSPAVVQASLARLSPQPGSTFGQPVSGSPRATIDSTYVVCTLDQAIAPTHQEAMSARCGSVVTLHTDHSPFVSMVPETADIIATAVAS